MNAARLANSPRLQRVDAFLEGGRWHSTRDIVRGADVCAVNSVVSELRRNGRQIETKSEGGRWYYRLVTEQQDLFAA